MRSRPSPSGVAFGPQNRSICTGVPASNHPVFGKSPLIPEGLDKHQQSAPPPKQGLPDWLSGRQYMQHRNRKSRTGTRFSTTHGPIRYSSSGSGTCLTQGSHPTGNPCTTRQNLSPDGCIKTPEPCHKGIFLSACDPATANLWCFRGTRHLLPIATTVVFSTELQDCGGCVPSTSREAVSRPLAAQNGAGLASGS